MVPNLLAFRSAHLTSHVLATSRFPSPLLATRTSVPARTSSTVASVASLRSSQTGSQLIAAVKVNLLQSVQQRPKLLTMPPPALCVSLSRCYCVSDCYFRANDAAAIEIAHGTEDVIPPDLGNATCTAVDTIMAKTSCDFCAHVTRYSPELANCPGWHPDVAKACRNRTCEREDGSTIHLSSE